MDMYHSVFSNSLHIQEGGQRQMIELAEFLIVLAVLMFGILETACVSWCCTGYEYPAEG